MIVTSHREEINFFLLKFSVVTPLVPILEHVQCDNRRKINFKYANGSSQHCTLDRIKNQRLTRHTFFN